MRPLNAAMVCTAAYTFVFTDTVILEHFSFDVAVYPVQTLPTKLGSRTDNVLKLHVIIWVEDGWFSKAHVEVSIAVWPNGQTQHSLASGDIHVVMICNNLVQCQVGDWNSVPFRGRFCRALKGETIKCSKGMHSSVHFCVY